LGTPKDNAVDAQRKGRLAHGEQQHAARLNPLRVQEIRARHASGESICGIALEQGVSVCAITKAVHRITWKEVN
jgi:hypothetical protein